MKRHNITEGDLDSIKDKVSRRRSRESSPITFAILNCARISNVIFQQRVRVRRDRRRGEIHGNIACQDCDFAAAPHRFQQSPRFTFRFIISCRFYWGFWLGISRRRRREIEIQWVWKSMIFFKLLRFETRKNLSWETWKTQRLKKTKDFKLVIPFVSCRKLKCENSLFHTRVFWEQDQWNGECINQFDIPEL